jgi:hypothetical protein
VSREKLVGEFQAGFYPGLSSGGFGPAGFYPTSGINSIRDYSYVMHSWLCYFRPALINRATGQVGGMGSGVVAHADLAFERETWHLRFGAVIFNSVSSSQKK